MRPTCPQYLTLALAASICVQEVYSPDAFFLDPHARELQVGELQAGQQVQLFTDSNTENTVTRYQTEIKTRFTQVAGTVVSVDDQRIVLCDAITITQSARMTGTPIVSKVPYFSRLFKNSGIAHESVPIPGEISIPRSEILLAGELSSSGAEMLNQAQQFERIGIDFDFSNGRTQPSPATH
jgi:hypothetical protein